MRRPPGRGVLAAVSCATFLTALDATVVTVALPQLQHELHLDQADLEWVAAGYPLTYASLLLIGGRTADRHGHRTTLLTGTALFTAASILCALAPTGTLLIAGRLLQGAAAALIFPAALTVVTHHLPDTLRTTGVSLLTATVAVALATGPVISGVVTEHLGWPWLFALNVPLAAAAWTTLWATMPRPPTRRPHPAHDTHDTPLDLALVCLALAGCAYSLIEGHRQGPTSPAIWTAWSITAAALTYVVIHQTTTPTRLPAITLLRNRTYAGAITAQLLWGLGVNGMFFFTAPYLTHTAGLTPTTTGLAFTPIAATLLLLTPLLPKTLTRYGPRTTVTTGLATIATGMAYLAYLAPTPHLPLLLAGLAILGAGSALTIPLTTHALTNTPHTHAATAAALYTATREASGTLGIALIGVITTIPTTNHPTEWAHTYRTALTTAAILITTAIPPAWRALTPHQTKTKPTNPHPNPEPPVRRS